MFGIEDLLPLAGTNVNMHRPALPPQLANVNMHRPALPPQKLPSRQRVAPIRLPKPLTTLPLDQMPFDQLPLESADLQLTIYEASLKMPEVPKPIEPTKTGRRRRMIPLKILDHKVFMPSTSICRIMRDRIVGLVDVCCCRLAFQRHQGLQRLATRKLTVSETDRCDDKLAAHCCVIEYTWIAGSPDLPCARSTICKATTRFNCAIRAKKRRANQAESTTIFVKTQV